MTTEHIHINICGPRDTCTGRVSARAGQARQGPPRGTLRARALSTAGRTPAPGSFKAAPTASGAARGQKTYYYHEYNHHYHHAKYASNGAGQSGRSNRSSATSQHHGRPDLQMARHAVENARQAASSEIDTRRAEGVIRREIDRAVQYCGLDVVAFARALDCDASSVRCARRAIAMRYHPDKVSCVMEGDSEAVKARKRLEGALGHEILSALNSL